MLPLRARTHNYFRLMGTAISGNTRSNLVTTLSWHNYDLRIICGTWCHSRRIRVQHSPACCIGLHKTGWDVRGVPARTRSVHAGRLRRFEHLPQININRAILFDLQANQVDLALEERYWYSKRG